MIDTIRLCNSTHALNKWKAKLLIDHLAVRFHAEGAIKRELFGVLTRLWFVQLHLPNIAIYFGSNLAI